MEEIFSQKGNSLQYKEKVNTSEGIFLESRCISDGRNNFEKNNRNISLQKDEFKFLRKHFLQNAEIN